MPMRSLVPTEVENTDDDGPRVDMITKFYCGWRPGVTGALTCAGGHR